MPNTATGLEVLNFIDDTYESEPVVGPQLQDVGEQLVLQNNRLPIESMPVITDNIQATINRLEAQRHIPGANIAEIERKIGLLLAAKGHVAEAAAGLMTARQGYANYLGDAALIDLGARFKF